LDVDGFMKNASDDYWAHHEKLGVIGARLEKLEDAIFEVQH
jgi:hypothetical protein